MTATTVVSPSPARTPGPARDAMGRDASSGANDAVALFAEMVSRADGQMDDAAAATARRRDERAGERRASPDDVMAGMMGLPPAREAPARKADGDAGPADAGKHSSQVHEANGAGSAEAMPGRDRGNAAGNGAASAAGGRPGNGDSTTVRDGTPAGQAADRGAADGGNSVATQPGGSLSSARPDMRAELAAAAGARAARTARGNAGEAATTTTRAMSGSATDAAQAPDDGVSAAHGASRSNAPDATHAAVAGAVAGDAAPAGAAAIAAATRRAHASATTRTDAAAQDRMRPAGSRRGGIESGTTIGRGRPGAGAREAIGREGGETPSSRAADFAAATNGGADAAALQTTGTQAGLAGASAFATALDAASATGEAGSPASAATEATALQIDIPLHDDAFAEAFARQAAELVIQGSNRAEISLNPRELGPVRIAIALDLDAASIDISADHRETRAALEASMPTLRQMLADQGVRLSDWRVAGDTADRRTATADGGAAFGSHAGGSGADGGAQAGAQHAMAGTGKPAASPRGGGDTPADRSSASDLARTVGNLRPDPSRGGNRLDLFA